MIRETVSAFAVLLVYALVLLAPLHQAAGLQRALGQIGYAPTETWSVCTPLVEDLDKGGETPTAAKCPLVGVAKAKIAAVLPDVPVLDAPLVQPGFYASAEQTALHPRLFWHPLQARAPPVLV